MGIINFTMSNTTESTNKNEQTQTNPSDTNTAKPETSPLSGNELKEAIKYQIEYYFSPQNLPNDNFLLSKMDEDQFVAVSVIANFGKITALTKDHEVIVESIADSKYLELSPDKSKIRPKEEKRSRIILHNLPPETTNEDVKEIFSKGNFSPEIEPEVNYCWFISFDTKEEATSALEFIRQQKIHDKKIRARLKPETSLRTYTPTQFVPQPALVYPSYPYAPMYWPDNFNRNFEGKENPYNRRSNPKKGGRKDNRKPYDGNKKRQGPNRKNKGRDNKKQSATVLGPSDFPPLPSASTSKNTGYSGAFVKYTHAEIVSSIKKLNSEKPSDLGDEFPVLSEHNNTIESETIVTLETEDLPAKTAPVPLSERVKKSVPAVSPPAAVASAPAAVATTAAVTSEKKNKTQAKDTKKGKAKAAPQPKPVKTTQEKQKGSSWSQIAKAGDQKKKTGTKAAMAQANKPQEPAAK